MKISVAMATYNGERFVREQLDSLAAQTRPPDELIVVDDCSADRTLDIVAEFSRAAPFPVMSHRNSRNLGWSENFLKAISLCNGDWIALCDQDDVWMSTKLSMIERQIGGETSESEVVLWVHSAQVTDECLRPSKVRFPDIRRRRVVGGRRLPIWSFFPGFALVVRADLVPLLCDGASQRGADPNVPSIPMAHDGYICQIAKSVGAVGMLPEVLAAYRRHGATTTDSFRGGNEDVHASVRFIPLVKHSLRVGSADFYARHSQSARRLSAICRCLANGEKGRKWRDHLLSAEAEYGAYADWTATRSHIYREASASIRLTFLFRAICRYGYFRFYGVSWRHGARALAKDCLVALVGSHRVRGVKAGQTPR
jgi:glycosyltransferase involved in cell wall biosynthesis